MRADPRPRSPEPTGSPRGGCPSSWPRYRAEGEAAFEPRSRRPKTSPSATVPETVELIVRLRKELPEQGLDAGPDTIAWHLTHHQVTVSRATIARHLTNRGLVTPQPTKRPRVTGPIVRDTFRHAVAAHGVPASTLTDNGMVFTTRLAGGRNALEAELRRLHIRQKNSTPGHPTTCGKVERFQQTMKNWLLAQPNQPADITDRRH